MNEGLIAVHKALLAAQACLDAAQHALVVCLNESAGSEALSCGHPVESRIVIDTLGGRETMCNVCGQSVN
jgi:hypothetical protein